MAPDEQKRQRAVYHRLNRHQPQGELEPLIPVKLFKNGLVANCVEQVTREDGNEAFEQEHLVRSLRPVSRFRGVLNERRSIFL